MSDRRLNLFDVPQRDIAESEHPHWKQPRIPSRKVRRRLARKAGMFRPVRYSRGKGKGGRLPYYHHQDLKKAVAEQPGGVIPSVIGWLRKGVKR